MLARKFRLPPSIRFSQAVLIREELFTCKFQPNNLELCRFGFIVSKTIDKSAAVRNRLKRLVRSFVEKKIETLQGYDVLFILRSGIKNATREEIQEKVESSLANLQ